MDYNQVIDAAKRIAPYILPTPLISSRLGDSLKIDLRLKPECRQQTGSFKIRGAFNKLLQRPTNMGNQHVVTASSGNHGIGVAYAAKLLNMTATVVVPENANAKKVHAVQSHGAEIVVWGTTSQERREKAHDICKNTGALFLHSHDDPEIIAGQGTIGLEITEEWMGVEAIVVPVGGGGLIAGISLLRQLHPAVTIIGVEPEGSAGTQLSIENKQLTPFPHVATIADGLRAAKPGKLNFEIIMNYVDSIVTVSDQEILAAMFKLLDQDKILVEPSGAAPVAAVLAGKIPDKFRNIVVVLSGGNIAIESLIACHSQS